MCSSDLKIYKAFEWLQGLEEKMSQAAAEHSDIENMNQIIADQEVRFGKIITELEEELAELKAPKKPKKKATKKKSK